MRVLTRALQQAACARYIPSSPPAVSSDIQKLEDFVAESQKLLVLTGAGLSTESGIPDYRSEGVGMYARTTRRPVQYQEFVKSAAARKSYWARNFVGWPNFSAFQPNICHRTLNDWEKKGKLQWIVTQNVDALHSKAGSRQVTELHGCTHRVVCLSCDHTMDRWHLQSVFQDVNPAFEAHSVEILPDGDVSLTEEQIKEFKVCIIDQYWLTRLSLIFLSTSLAFRLVLL